MDLDLRHAQAHVYTSSHWPFAQFWTACLHKLSLRRTANTCQQLDLDLLKCTGVSDLNHVAMPPAQVDPNMGKKDLTKMHSFGQKSQKKDHCEYPLVSTPSFSNRPQSSRVHLSPSGSRICFFRCACAEANLSPVISFTL